MKTKIVALGLSLVLASSAALAELEPYKDYSISDAVWGITTIKVAANMGDVYLEGLKKTWVESSEIAKKLGQVDEYHIYQSALPESGNFNMMLVVKYKNAEAMAPSKARYDAFMKEWGAERNKKTAETAQTVYPKMREITGEYAMHEITMK